LKDLVMSKTKVFLYIFVSLFTFWARSSEAQIIFGQKGSTNFGAYYQSWELKGQTDTVKLSQWALPVDLFIPIKDNFELRIFISGASTALDQAGAEYYLRELNDTKVQVAGSFLDDRYLVSLGVNIPSGRESLEGKETEIASFLFLDFLNFPVRNLGEGLKFNLSFARAFQGKNLTWGLGGGYQYNQSYNPYHDLSEYKPGDRVHLTGGFSSNPNKVKLSGDLTYTIYQADEQEGRKIFKDGNQLDMKSSFLYSHKRFSLALNARIILRDKDKRYGAAKIYLEEAKNHGDDLRFSALLSYRLGSKVKLLTQAEAEVIRVNDYPPSHPLYLGTSQLLGFGGGLAFELNDSFCYGVILKAFQGEADDGKLDLAGLGMQSSLFVRF